MDKSPDPELRRYIEENIIPRYRSFDKGHGEDHVRTVIGNAMELAAGYDVDRNMVYCAAACHDIGLAEGREFHHLSSGRMIREDRQLRRWFDEEQIETIAQAAEDHRASGKGEPRSVYGRITAEADRDIDPMKIIRRTVQFSLSHYPGLSKEEHRERFLSHLAEKYAEGGYLRLWIPESKNASRLQELRCVIKDRSRLDRLFDDIFREETGSL